MSRLSVATRLDYRWSDHRCAFFRPRFRGLPTDTRAASKRFVSTRLVASVENRRAAGSVLLSAGHTGTPPEGSGTGDSKRREGDQRDINTIPMAPPEGGAALDRFALSAVTAALVTAGPATAAYTPWTSSSVVGPGTAFRDAAAVVVGPTVEDLLWVAENGSVQQETHYQGIGWFANQVAPAGSADPYADIAAVARGGGSGVGADVDVFWFGPQGSIEQEFELPGGPYYRYPQLAPPGQRNAVRKPGGRLARVGERGSSGPKPTAGSRMHTTTTGVRRDSCNSWHQAARARRSSRGRSPRCRGRRTPLLEMVEALHRLPAPSGTEPSRLAAAVRLRLREPPARD